LNNIINIRTAILFIGIFLTSLGSAIMIKVFFIGLQPWDATYKGLSEISGLSIGKWVIILQASMIFLAMIIEKKLPKMGTF
jgi:uncharacterized membrane protein YczE